MQRIDRTLRRLANQHTARTNAAEATAELRRRRHEQEEVDAYLLAQPWTYTTAQAAGHRGSPVAANSSPSIADNL
jgi:hypothetical protein